MKTFKVALNPPLQKMNTKEYDNDCTTMGDWLWVYSVVDVVPSIKAFKKMAEQYYPDKIDVCKDAVSIPRINVIRAKQVHGKKQKA